ncbi:hypothetical protein SEQ_HALENA_97 [Mycobacterium phage Halena]|uniref:Uncharacterized protein n=10 Tax=Bronvirus TaxID=1623278 RepID=E0YPN1_9CAUD|nr:hypothetical protein LEBRON_98 [Mycobacterium phage LeBron]YP_009635945.1 hypothetical protein FGG55_gp100 [Mycobacterium phage JoeDirt]YP_010100991.1 hypothetical protein KNU44_gp095 [Mycobacterium phage CicholasNage]YP_010101402.1 hypothetical protein KNU48_gp063 [Mycobacterium phage Silverleaf]YP_010105497.1 hypothetical protein KNU85_gp095 [Mycobacterium phage DirkDirk]YP_010114794.1 hypothetical protein KNV76_gp094 [Mycobacterium phage OhShagHennessy]AEK07628.1 hypothetical protein UP
MSDTENQPDDQGNLMVAELRIVQYIDSEGTLNTVDLSQGPGGKELAEEEYSQLIDWAQAFTIAPKVAAILAADD